MVLGLIEKSNQPVDFIAGLPSEQSYRLKICSGEMSTLR
jgi:hypothetical protein